MSSFDVGTAFVRVVPIDIGFQAALQAQVNRAVASVQVPPIAATAAVETERAAAAAAGAAAQNEILTASSAASAVAAERQAAAQLSLTAALETQRLAEEQLAAARLRGAEAAAIETLQNRALAAAEAARAAGATVQAAVAAGAAQAAAAEQALATAQAEAAISGEAAAAAATQSAVANEALANSVGAVVATTARQAEAEAALTAALETERVAQQQLTLARLAGAEASSIAAAESASLAAAEASRTAGAELQAATVAAAAAAVSAQQALATAQAEAAVSGEAAAAAAANIAVANEALASSAGAAVGSVTAQTDAEVALAAAIEAERAAQQRLTLARLAGVEASAAQVLQERLLAAQQRTAALSVAQPQVIASTVAPGAVIAEQALATAQAQAAVSAEAAAAAEAQLATANEALAASTASAAAGTETLSLAEASGTQQTAARAAAVLALTRALDRQAAAEARLTAAVGAGAAQAEIATLTTNLSRASEATNVARLRLDEFGKSSVSAGTRSDLLQGSIVGLSRVTAISALGLTAWSAAAVAAGLSLRSAIASTADFEHQLNVFQGTTNATAEEMQAVSDEAKALGADLSLPATSAGDAAVAMTELAKAGLTVQESLDGARGVLQLAAAAQISVGTAAEFVATELNAFELAGSQATHVADLLAGASIAAQGSIEDFGSAFQQVSAVSHQVNLSLEDTTGALTELAQAGLRGADGGTSLRTTLLRLAPTTKQAAEFQKALGVELDDTRSIGEQLPDLLDQYRLALEALTPVQQQQALTQIFGQDAIRAASILIRGGSEALRENTEAANQNGAASRLADANARGLSGAFAGLKSNLDTLGITMGDFVKEPLTGFVNALSSSVGEIDKTVGALVSLNKKIEDTIPNVLGLRDAVKDLFGIDLKGPLLGPVAAIKTVVDQIPGVGGRRGQQTAGQKAIDEAKKQNEAFVAGLEKVDQDFAKGIHDESARFGNELIDATKIHDETRTDGLKHLTDAQKAATQKRIKALEDAASGGKDLEVKIPVTLQARQIDAQISGNLQAEAEVDRKIITFLEKKRERLDHNSAAYIAIGNQLRDAKRALQSVLDQATTDASQPVKIPIALQNAQLDAEISGNLQAELRTDQKIVDFLTKSLERAKGSAVKYKAVGEALKAAVSARDSVLSQIQSNQREEAQKRQEIFQTGIENQQVRLELAAQAAGLNSDAEKKLIAFLAQEARDSRLTDAQQLAFEKERRSEIAKVRASIVETAKAQIDLQNSRFELRQSILDTRLSAAELTPGIEDNRRVLNLQIKALNDDIVRQKALAAAAKKNSQERIDLLQNVQTDLQKINALKLQIKNLSGEGGQAFTLQDLFKEAVEQFNAFGSNIAGRSGILSPQDARASLGRNIIADLSAKQVTEQEKTNQLLETMPDKIALAVLGGTSPVIGAGAGGVPSGRIRAFGGPAGLANAILAADNNFGAG